MNLIPVIEEVIRRRIPQTIESGTIQSVSADIAKVYISGSKQSVPAFFNDQNPPEQGDDCVLIRANRAAPWVILTSYSQRNRGHSVNKQTVPANLIGVTRSANVKSIAAGGTTSSTTTYGEKARVTIRTKGGALLVFWSGYGTGSNSTARILHARLLVDGSQEAEVIHQWPTTGGFQAGVHLMGIAQNIPAGNHVVVLETYATVANVALTGILHAAEI